MPKRIIYTVGNTRALLASRWVRLVVEYQTKHLPSETGPPLRSTAIEPLQAIAGCIMKQVERIDMLDQAIQPLL